MEFKQRLCKLDVFRIGFACYVVFVRYFFEEIIRVFLLAFFKLFTQWYHDKRLLFRRTRLGTQFTSCTIQRRDLDFVHVTLYFFALGFNGMVFYANRRIGHLLFVDKERANNCVRTHKSTLVTLDTVFFDPLGYHNPNTALFVLTGAVLKGAIFIAFKNRNRKVVAFGSIHRLGDFLDKIRTFVCICFIALIWEACPRWVNRYLNESISTLVDGLVV